MRVSYNYCFKRCIARSEEEDGNTARQCFKDYELTANITGIKVNIVKRFYVILQTISLGLPIDQGKFENYYTELAEECRKSYSWYYMPPTVHKDLIHGKCNFIIKLNNNFIQSTFSFWLSFSLNNCYIFSIFNKNLISIVNKLVSKKYLKSNCAKSQSDLVL